MMNQNINKNTLLVRQSNFELLRIVCMLFIVCGHMVLSHDSQLFSPDWHIGNFVLGFVCVAVNSFVLISGFWGINLDFKKLLRMNNMVTVYSIILFIISLVIGIHTLKLRADWMYLAPILTKKYWFITIYFVLCLLAPFLNHFIESISKKQYQHLLITLFVLFCIQPTFGFLLNFEAIVPDAGYGIVSFIFLYLLGRYIRIHLQFKTSKYWFLAIYFASTLSIGLSHLILSKILGFEFSSFISYNTLLCLLGAVGLFLFFSQLDFKSRIINHFAKYCLAVYVLHCHPTFTKYLFNDIIKVNEYAGITYILLLLVCPIIIFVGCSIIEASRLKICSLFSKSNR